MRKIFKFIFVLLILTAIVILLRNLACPRHCDFVVPQEIRDGRCDSLIYFLGCIGQTRITQ